MDKCWNEMPEDRSTFVELLPLLQSIMEEEEDIQENYHTLDTGNKKQPWPKDIILYFNSPHVVVLKYR